MMTTANEPPTLAEGCAAVRAGRLRPSQWLAACLDRIERLEPAAQAWAWLDRDLSRRAAAALDRTGWAAQQPPPLLAGAPVAIKDVFNTRDMPTGFGSPLYAGFQPGNDARAVAQLRLRGALPLGKTETAEFAVHEPRRGVNPHDPQRMPGTSSTGSAIAVACGMVPLALGSQTGGSILRPASYVGAIGFKPSFGMVPRTGVLKTCDTLDTIGWFARSVADCRLALDALRIDGRNYPMLMRGLAAAAARPRRRPLRLALARMPEPGAAASTEAALRRALDRLAREADIEIVERDFRAAFADAHATHRTIYHKSLAYHFQREMRRPEPVSARFAALVAEGDAIDLARYRAALDAQQALSDRLPALLDDVDAVVTPTAAGEAPLIGAAEPPDSCLVWTLLGAPAISLPLLSGPGGLPIGLQLAAPRYHDYPLLAVAEALYPGAVAIVDPRSAATLDRVDQARAG